MPEHHISMSDVELPTPQNAYSLICWFWPFMTEDINGHPDGPCQCGIEKLVDSCNSRQQMQAFLLAGVFIDQLIHEHFQEIYPQFRQHIKLPRFYCHFDQEWLSANWLLHPEHGYEQPLNWVAAKPIIVAMLTGSLETIYSLVSDAHAIDQFFAISEEEIESQFDSSSASNLRAITHDFKTNVLPHAVKVWDASQQNQY